MWRWRAAHVNPRQYRAIAASIQAAADRSGLTGALARALARPGFVPVNDRGKALADTAVLIADGGRVLSELATLRDQAELFGPIASDPTLWRSLDEISEPQRRKIVRARAAIREHVWSLIEKRLGPSVREARRRARPPGLGRLSHLPGALH